MVDLSNIMVHLPYTMVDLTNTMVDLHNTILSGYRQILSTTAARASSGCLLGRLSRIGEGHKAAARRRAWAKREGERIEEERKAHWRAHIQGRGVMRGNLCNLCKF